ncbi:MAG: hypothetical protein FH758_00960 [Firmicutes bacterium]|nr:hypothetical protein [Bacillota bacterium]
MYSRTKNEDATETANLLTTILVRYPEVSTINYYPQKNTLRLNFIFTEELSEQQVNWITNFIQTGIEVFGILEKNKTNIVKVNSEIIAGLTLIQLERDLPTLVQGEIGLIIKGLRQSGLPNIIIDNPDDFYEDDLRFQEEMIESMLENVKTTTESKPLFAFREEGRVLVFNK